MINFFKNKYIIGTIFIVILVLITLFIVFNINQGPDLNIVDPVIELIIPVMEPPIEPVLLSPSDASVELPIINNFEEAVSLLNTSQKIIAFLNRDFIFVDEQRESPLSPKDFFEKKQGNSWDFALFTSYLLWRNQYEASIIRYNYNNQTSAVVVFRDVDFPKTIIFTNEGPMTYIHGRSFRQMLEKEGQRLGFVINEYAVSYWADNGKLWPEEWIKINP